MHTNEMKDQKGSKLTILQMLRLRGGMSRIDLTHATGLSRATVSISIGELIENGLVYETDNRLTTKGRPATTVELTPRSCLMLGADLDNKAWTLGAFDLLGNVVQSVKIPVPTFDPVETFRLLAAEIGSFASGLDRPPVPLLGLGVPGLVDAGHSIIRSAADLEWHDVHVADLMKEATGWPTVVVNRHRARGLTECRYGAGQPYRNMIYIGVGMGIAAGLYIDRQLLSGSLGGAGEIGHTTIEPSGPLCPCGNRGCLQMLSAGPAIEREYRQLVRAADHAAYSGRIATLQLLKAQDVCAAAEAGDPLAAEAIGQAASFLGIAMANLLNTFNPEAIILGGTVAGASPLFVETATRVMRQRGMSPLAAETVVATAHFKDVGGALGAANFAFDKNLSFSFFA